MDKLTSILVVTNRSIADGTLLARAVLLARRVGARIHLFHCDAELAHVLRHSYDTQDSEKAWQASVSDHRSYLEALRASMHAPDLDISIGPNQAYVRSPVPIGVARGGSTPAVAPSVSGPYGQLIDHIRDAGS